MKKTFDGVDKWILWIENVVCVSTLVGIVSIATAGVIARYIFQAGFLWADEINQALLVAMAMFGSARAVRTGGHTEFTTISNKPKSKKVRILIRTIIMVITLALLIFLLINLAKYTASGTMLSAVLRVPRMYYYMSIPIGFALCIYEYLRTLKHKVLDDPVKEEE